MLTSSPAAEGGRGKGQKATVARRGSTLIGAIAALFALSFLVMTFFGSVFESSHSTTDQEDEYAVLVAADSAIAIAVYEIWGEFAREADRGDSTIFDFRFYLDQKGVLDRSGATDLIDLACLPRDDEGVVVDGVVVDTLEVFRTDDLARTHLRFVTSTAMRREGEDVSTDGAARAVEQVFEISTDEPSPLSYALLADNVDCLLCHTEIDNAERFYNDDPQRFGTHERVRVGVLESLQLRESAESWIAGTLYLRGIASGEYGHGLEDWGALSLDSREFDAEGHLLQDSNGELVPADLIPATRVAPQPLENLYLAYGGENGIDGRLPDSFPSPFPDTGGFDFDRGGPVGEDAGNRVIDDSEFRAAVAFVSGSISGGTISVAEPGERIATPAELVTLLTERTHETLSPVTEGNVYLRGTEDDPILLAGDVAIDGDLILHGFVKGVGTLRVRGNVFLPSDVRYLDGEGAGRRRTFGRAADGSKNALALAAGGNVVVGDLFRPAWGEGRPTNGERDGGFNFIMEQIALFNRIEWLKTQPTLPGRESRVQVGEETREQKTWDYEKIYYPKKKAVYEWVETGEERSVPKYAWVTESEGRPDRYGKTISKRVVVGQTTRPVVERVAKGHRIVTKYYWKRIQPPRTVTVTEPVYALETPRHSNPYYEGPGYIPRYYAFAEGGSIPVLNGEGYFDAAEGVWVGPERADGWRTDRLGFADVDGGGRPAVVSTLTASDGWISHEMLRLLIGDALADRDADEPLGIDGALYCNNGIFGIVPGREATGLDGRMRVNGAVFAADVGLLATSGLHLNYDARSAELIGLEPGRRLAIRRELFSPSGRP